MHFFFFYGNKTFFAFISIRIERTRKFQIAIIKIQNIEAMPLPRLENVRNKYSAALKPKILNSK